MQKVMKYELHYLEGMGDFHEMQNALWELQRQTREVLNKTLQICYQWEWRNRDNFSQTGSYLSVLEETGYKTIDGYAYHQLTPIYPNMSAANINATIRTAYKKFKATKREVSMGTVSIPSYKANQPLLFHNSSLRLRASGRDWIVEATLLSDKYKRETGWKNPIFSIFCGDNTQRTILQRVTDNAYKVGQSQITYQKEKKKWFLYLTYEFTPEKKSLEPDKILGVDLGIKVALLASSFGAKGCYVISGNEKDDILTHLKQRGVQTEFYYCADEGNVPERIRKLEDIRRSKQKQSRYCGEGRIGHGTKTRIATVDDARSKIANLQKTLNHRWSRALVDYAVKNGYGTIQMEDLSGIKEDTGFDKLLRHWTYYDLQEKIASKAGEQGIIVRKINPRYTSQRCSRCGYISAENRQTQERFLCVNCGFSANADYNASQNISIRNIEEVIENDMANTEKPPNAKIKRAKKTK